MTAEHRRPVCINPGCGRVLGRDDEGYRTTAGVVAACNDCIDRARPAWMRPERDARPRESVEGLA